MFCLVLSLFFCTFAARNLIYLNMNKKENSARIQTSILNPLEKKALIWMAERLPLWVTSDMLTYFSLFGAVVIAAGYLLTNYDPAASRLARWKPDKALVPFPCTLLQTPHAPLR